MAFQYEVILSNPTDHDLEAFFDQGLSQADRFLASPGVVSPAISKIVCAYEGGRLVHLYSVRQDAVAILPEGPSRSE
jgi:hypothetical protein